MIFNGIIGYESFEWSQTTIDGHVLVNEIDFDGQFVSLRYFISDNPITNPVQQFIATLYGDCEIENSPIVGTEWTGQYSAEDGLIVGGHDLIEELTKHLGKYCYLEIEIGKEFKK